MSILAIGKWNYTRNKLVFDEELELAMLAEEENEFKDGMLLYFDLITIDNYGKDAYIINSVVEMIDAYCDYMYVYTGTSIKSIGTDVIFDCSHKQSLMNSVLNEILITHGTQLYNKQQAELPFMERCYQFVIDANEAKSKKVTKGKVTKTKNFKDPKDLIREELLSSGFLANTDEALERYKADITKKIDTKAIVSSDTLVGSEEGKA